MSAIVWKGIAYESIELCRILAEEEVIQVHSKILGADEGRAYSVAYNVKLTNNWEVLEFAVNFSIDDRDRVFVGSKQGSEWLINGIVDHRFSSYKYIDISLTPFTNTLPLRNLSLQDGQESIIDVIYINILDNDIYAVKQNYRRNSATNYRFQNVPNDFEANIEVDASGLVVNYPALFERLI